MQLKSRLVIFIALVVLTAGLVQAMDIRDAFGTDDPTGVRATDVWVNKIRAKLGLKKLSEEESKPLSPAAEKQISRLKSLQWWVSAANLGLRGGILAKNVVDTYLHEMNQEALKSNARIDARKAALDAEIQSKATAAKEALNALVNEELAQRARFHEEMSSQAAKRNQEYQIKLANAAPIFGPPTAKDHAIAMIQRQYNERVGK